MRVPLRPQAELRPRCRCAGLLPALCLGALLLATPLAASAQCLPDPAATGDTVTCSGTDADGFAAGMGVENLSVDVERAAEVTDPAPGGAALSLNSGNTVTIAPSELVGDPAVEEPGGRITVSGANSRGLVAGDDNAVTHDGVFSVAGDDAIGIEAGSRNAIEILDTSPEETEATLFEVTGIRAIGIKVNDNNPITNDAQLTVGGEDAVGIRADSNNTIVNRATLAVSGLRAVGIDLTGSGNDVDNAAGATLVVSGDDAVGIRLPNEGDNLFNAGEIQVSGAGAVGLQGGNGIGDQDPDPFRSIAGIGNLTGGSINVTGAAAAGIDIPDDGVILNRGAIVVGSATEGAGSAGMRANSGSLVFNAAGGSITAAGMGALGIQLTGEGNRVLVLGGSEVIGITVSGENAIGIGGPGGNDVTVNGEISATGTGSVGIELSGVGSILDNSVTNRGTIRADAIAAAALRFSGGGTGESTFTNEAASGVEAADTIAVDGSDAVEHVVNRGMIQGDVLLRGGDDSFRQELAGSFEGGLDAGAGLDALELVGAARFDLGTVSNFETLSILASPQLSTIVGSASFADGIEVMGDAALRADGAATLTGGYMQRSGGALHVQLSQTDDPVPVLASDRLSVDGAVTFEDGSILEMELIDPATPHPLPTGVVTVLDASAGITGEVLLQSAATQSAVLSFESGVDASGQELQITVSRAAYAGFGNGNGASMGGYLDGLLPGASGSTAALLASLDTLGPAALAEGLATLHPEGYDASTSAALAAGLEFTRRLHRRPLECGIFALPERPEVKTLSSCGELGIAPWLDVSGLGATRKADSFHIDYDHFGAMTAVGIDARPAEGWLVSGSVGGGHHWLDSDDASGRLATIDVGASVSARLGPLRVRGAASYGRGLHRLDRSVQLGGSSLEVDGDWESDRVTLLGSVAWPLVVWNWSLAPELQLDYAHLFEEAVGETGGAASLALEERDNGVLGVGGLVRLSSSVLWLGPLSRVQEWWRGTITRSFHLGVRGVPTGAERNLTARLQSAGAGSSVRVRGQDAAWMVRAGLGLDFQPWTSAGSVSAHYDVDVGDGSLLQRIELRVHVPF